MGFYASGLQPRGPRRTCISGSETAILWPHNVRLRANGDSGQAIEIGAVTATAPNPGGGLHELLVAYLPCVPWTLD